MIELKEGMNEVFKKGRSISKIKWRHTAIKSLVILAPLDVLSVRRSQEKEFERI